MTRKLILQFQSRFSGFDSAVTTNKDLQPPQPPIFVVGAPRVGSTLLFQSLLNQFEFCYISNLMAAMPNQMVKACRLAPAISTNNPRSIKESQLGYVPGFWGPNEAGAIFRHWFGTDRDERHRQLVRNTVAELSLATKRPLLSKNQFNSLRIEKIHKILPEACFIYLKRDPLYVGQSLLLARLREFGNYNQWWSLKPLGFEQVLKHNPAFQVIWQVMATNLFVESRINKLGLKHVIVNYEDFCRSPESALKYVHDAFNFLNLSGAPVPSPAIKISKTVRVDDITWSELQAAWDELRDKPADYFFHDPL